MLSPGFVIAERPVSYVSGSTILAGSEIGYPPYCIVDDTGQAEGFSVELLRETLAVMGYGVEFKVDQWSVVKHDLEIGAVQVLPLVGRTPEREPIFDFTFPYLTMHGTLLVNSEEKTILSVEDLGSHRVAVMKGDNAEEYARRSLPTAELITTETFSEAMQLLSARQVDAVIIQHFLALQLMKELQIDNVRTTGPPIKDFTQSFCFAVQKGDTELLSILNEGLSLVIANNTYDELYTRWFYPIRSLGEEYDRVIIGGDIDYPPYEYLDENGEPTGFNVDLSQAIAQELGIEIEILLDRWSTTYDRLLSGEIDLIEGVFYSPERDRVLSFSQPHSVVSHVIVTREGEFPDISTMEDLAGLKIIVMDKDIMHNKVIEFGYENQAIIVSDQEEGLRLLAAGGGDCALTAKMPTSFWIAKHQWENLEIRSQVLALDYAFAALEGGSETLLQRFSEGLSTLKTNGEYQRIYNKWFSVYEKTSTTPLQIIRDFAFVFLPILAVALLLLLWTWMLRKQVHIRTSELRETTEHLQEEIARKEQAQLRIAASEKKFREYVEHSPIGIFECDAAGRITDSNPALTHIIGMEREQLSQCAIFDEFRDHTDTPDLVPHTADESQANPLPIHFKRRDGHWRSITLLTTHIGQDRYLGFVTDVTDLVMIQQELAADKERLQVTLRSIGDGVITTDIEGRISLMNRVAEELTGWTQAEAEGLSLTEVFVIAHEHTGDECINPVDAVLKSGAITDMAANTQLTSRTGEKRIIADSGAPIKDPEGNIIGVVLVFRDMTSELRIQERLQQTTRLDALGLLAGGIAHDFNNLLSGLFGFIQLAKQSALQQEDCTPYLDEVLKTFDRTKALTQQLLTFARGGQPVREVRNLRSIIMENANFALSGSQITSEFNIAEDLWYSSIDAHQIGQVIDNIIINAIQAMPSGGRVVITGENIELADEAAIPPLKAGEFIHICISDTGPGIPPAIIDKIFDPFFTTKEAGNGLGLATSYSIITKHDGTISVTSLSGNGTTFHIYLPKAVEHTTRVAEKESVSKSGSGKIIILDDEKILRVVIGKMVASLGYIPIEVADGESVLELCRDIHSQVDAGEISETGIVAALFDLTIPGKMGGKEAVIEIRKICPDIPIFASSGYSEDAIMANPTEFGFTDSIAKPFKLEELSNLLVKYVAVP